jgi:hypothetical protein
MDEQLFEDIQAFLNRESIVLEFGWPPTPYEIELSLSEGLMDEEDAKWWYEQIGADWENREPL